MIHQHKVSSNATYPGRGLYLWPWNLFWRMSCSSCQCWLPGAPSKISWQTKRLPKSNIHRRQLRTWVTPCSCGPTSCPAWQRIVWEMLLHRRRWKWRRAEGASSWCRMPGFWAVDGILSVSYIRTARSVCLKGCPKYNIHMTPFSTASDFLRRWHKWNLFSLHTEDIADSSPH